MFFFQKIFILYSLLKANNYNLMVIKIFDIEVFIKDLVENKTIDIISFIIAVEVI